MVGGQVSRLNQSRAFANDPGDPADQRCISQPDKSREDLVILDPFIKTRCNDFIIKGYKSLARQRDPESIGPNFQFVKLDEGRVISAPSAKKHASVSGANANRRGSNNRRWIAHLLLGNAQVQSIIKVSCIGPETIGLFHWSEAKTEAGVWGCYSRNFSTWSKLLRPTSNFEQFMATLCFSIVRFSRHREYAYQNLLTSLHFKLALTL